MAIVDVTIVPLGTKSTSISPYVSECHRVLNQQTLVKYQLTPMGTVLEGDLNDILEIIKIMHETPFIEGAMRVATTIKIDDRRDKNSTMTEKMQAVYEKL